MSSWSYSDISLVRSTRLFAQLPTTPLISLVLLSGLLFWSAAISQAAEFCAITLDVRMADGTPSRYAHVALINPEGKVVWQTLSRQPEVRICDFGFGTHSLRVSSYGYFPVTFADLRLILGMPLHLKAVLNQEPYGDPMHSGCWVYLRVRSEDDKPVPYATFVPSLYDLQEARVDGYGRYQTLFWGTREITFSAPGFLSSKTTLECKDGEAVEQLVLMKKAN